MKDLGKIVGPRIMVEELPVVDSITARAAAAGLHVVIDKKNEPRATVGRIVLLGTDPLFEDWGLKVGMKVTYGIHAGSAQFIEGKPYRVLETQEIIRILPPDEATEPIALKSVLPSTERLD